LWPDQGRNFTSSKEIEKRERSGKYGGARILEFTEVNTNTVLVAKRIDSASFFNRYAGKLDR
ncbi:MAG: hypothetical protein KA250_17455, partial [Verrucomicrobiales bacterium]|nr:hypothetical protein [Verrucomicrobiales bacterium]